MQREKSKPPKKLTIKRLLQLLPTGLALKSIKHPSPAFVPLFQEPLQQIPAPDARDSQPTPLRTASFLTQRLRL